MRRFGVVGGSLRAVTGVVTFAAGGALSSDETLDPAAQAIVDTLQDASRRGTAAVATITCRVACN